MKTIKYQTIRRVRITSPMSEREEVLDWLFKNDYRIRVSGPWPRRGGGLDVNKLLVIAEKRIK